MKRERHALDREDDVGALEAVERIGDPAHRAELPLQVEVRVVGERRRRERAIALGLEGVEHAGEPGGAMLAIHVDGAGVGEVQAPVHRELHGEQPIAEQIREGDAPHRDGLGAHRHPAHVDAEVVEGPILRPLRGEPEDRERIGLRGVGGIDRLPGIEAEDLHRGHPHQAEAAPGDHDAEYVSLRSRRRRADLRGHVGDPHGDAVLDPVQIPPAAGVRGKEEAGGGRRGRLLQRAIGDDELRLAGLRIEEDHVRVADGGGVGDRVDPLFRPVEAALGVGRVGDPAQPVDPLVDPDRVDVLETVGADAGERDEGAVR